MLSNNFSIVDLTDRLSKDDELKDNLVDLCYHLKMDHASYFVADVMAFHLPCCDTFPDEWKLFYAQEGCAARDPVYVLAGALRTPKFLDDLLRNEVFSEIWIDDAGDCGLQPPRFAIPVPGPCGTKMSVVFHGSEIMKDDAARRRIARKAVAGCRDLHMNVMESYGLYELLDIPQLSPRELELIQLSTEGMRASDISAVLDIATKTVEEGLKNAKKKLGCKTIQQATYAAGVLSLINANMDLVRERLD